MGLVYESGTGMAQNYPQAAVFYRKACDGADFLGCSRLALLYQEGNGVAKDPAQAVTLFRKSCDGANADGCRGLGMALM